MMSTDTAAIETSVGVRAATLPDADAVAAIMARAFFDDPLICAILTNEETRQTDMPKLFHLLFELGLPHGACDVTLGYEAAALWRPPGAWRTPWWDYLANGLEVFDIFDYASARRALRVMDLIEKRHPEEPHWYLQGIGTDPAKQGRGFGGAVMRSRLATVDAEGLPAYLETSKDANIPFYRSFGFEVSGEIKLPDGPTVWSMWREARRQI